MGRQQNRKSLGLLRIQTTCCVVHLELRKFPYHLKKTVNCICAPIMPNLACDDDGQPQRREAAISAEGSSYWWGANNKTSSSSSSSSSSFLCLKIQELYYC